MVDRWLCGGVGWGIQAERVKSFQGNTSVVSFNREFCKGFFRFCNKSEETRKKEYRSLKHLNIELSTPKLAEQIAEIDSM